MSHIIAGNQGLRSIQHAAASSTLTFNCLEEEEASLFPIGAPTPTTPTYPVRILHVAYRNRLSGKYLASLFNVAYLQARAKPRFTCFVCFTNPKSRYDFDNV